MDLHPQYIFHKVWIRIDNPLMIQLREQTHGKLRDTILKEIYIGLIPDAVDQLNQDLTERT